MHYEERVTGAVKWAVYSWFLFKTAWRIKWTSVVWVYEMKAFSKLHQHTKDNFCIISLPFVIFKLIIDINNFFYSERFHLHIFNSWLNSLEVSFCFVGKFNNPFVQSKASQRTSEMMILQSVPAWLNNICLLQ